MTALAGKEQRELQRFVNALREVLGLSWLYGPEPPSLYWSAESCLGLDDVEARLADDALAERAASLVSPSAPRPFNRFRRAGGRA